MQFNRLRRREFFTLASGAAAWPLAARAQQSERVRHVGWLSTGDDAEGRVRLAAFARAVKQLGWSEDRNLRIDIRWATADNIRRHAADLVALAPDVVVAASGTATVAPGTKILLRANHVGLARAILLSHRGDGDTPLPTAP